MLGTGPFVVIDFGNAYWKWALPPFDRNKEARRRAKFGSMYHALVKIGDSDWKADTRGGTVIPAGYFRVNGVPYLIGDDARAHVVQRKSGAARYKMEYYGVGIACIMAEALRQSDEDIALFLGHPPRDERFSEVLVGIGTSKYHVECAHGVFDFQANSVDTFNEPLGGFANVILTLNGLPRKGNPLKGRQTWIGDLGGGTFDNATINPNGSIDTYSLESIPMGLNDVMKRFESLLRTTYMEEFQSNRQIDPQLLTAAFMSGKYPYGNRRKLNCKTLADEASAPLLTQISDRFDESGGMANYQQILWTGGGPITMRALLAETFPDVGHIFASNDQDELAIYSNAIGAGKLAQLIDSAVLNQ